MVSLNQSHEARVRIVLLESAPPLHEKPIIHALDAVAGATAPRLVGPRPPENLNADIALQTFPPRLCRDILVSIGNPL